MELFEKLKVQIPHAVLVDSFTGTQADDEVLEFLKRYGSIVRTEKIVDKNSEFNQHLVIEYNNREAVDALLPQLPYSFVASTKDIHFTISSLSDIYADQVCNTKTQTYLSELKMLAKATGKDFAQVLQDMMLQIGGTVSEFHSGAANIKESPGTTAVTENQTERLQATSVESSTYNPAPQSQTRPSLSSLSPSDINPPDVQRYVVEHIVKSEDHSMHLLTSQKLRAFSGKVPRPVHESDFETWRASVDLIMKDPAISDLQRSRKILESLLPPAADMVKHLGTDILPDVYLQQLDSAYGTVQDGDELYAKFMDTFQDAGELPSTYLQRLQVALNLAIRRGGAKEADANKHLVNQFCRGCWDNALISELQLPQRKTRPPSFAELLLLLRTEEDRRAAKAVRMKHHLGAAKQRATVNSQLAEEHDSCAALTTITQQLGKQMAEIQKQLAALTSAQSGNHSQPSQSRYTSGYNPKPRLNKFSKSSAGQSPSVPKPGYCFRCGEDGHTRPQCPNPPDPSRVASQRRKFNEKLQQWQNQNSSNGSQLN